MLIVLAKIHACEFTWDTNIDRTNPAAHVLEVMCILQGENCVLPLLAQFIII